MSYAFNDFIRDVTRDYVRRDWEPVLRYIKQMRSERVLTPRQRAAARRREKALAKARREIKAILKRFPELSNELQDDDE